MSASILHEGKVDRPKVAVVPKQNVLILTEDNGILLTDLLLPWDTDIVRHDQGVCKESIAPWGSDRTVIYFFLDYR